MSYTMPTHHTVDPNPLNVALAIVAAVSVTSDTAASANKSSDFSISIGALVLGVVAGHYRLREGRYTALSDLTTPLSLLVILVLCSLTPFPLSSQITFFGKDLIFPTVKRKWPLPSSGCKQLFSPFSNAP